jgi:DNA-binding ferritin-like protein
MQAPHTDVTATKGSHPLEGLTDHLAAINVPARGKQMYLNERDPRSIALQKLFDRVVNDIEAYSDQLAVLAAVFDGWADETPRTAADHRLHIAYPDGFADNATPVSEVAMSLNAFRANVRNAIGETVTSGDFAKARLFVDVLSDIDAQLSAIKSQSAAKVSVINMELDSELPDSGCGTEEKM